ncbi:hypothetical protein DEJ45_15470 [Streptomyces venezuelae]|uniref:hypothetical protein n=1 Tax=Streptomyces venezuelae TaxID=54571 RepID=UPI00123D280B|nr:hypothetical protein [Streptomyces venezuelae]QES17364.1 hypothetical protein DEJ45_15470 [Streptomyces venezuelae]
MEEGARSGAEAARRLARTGRAEMLPGLSDAEFDRIEEEFGFAFSDDHRAFLAAGLPVGRPDPHGRPSSWPNWRGPDRDDLRWRLERPVDGVLFDVEHNSFWRREWGPRPAAPAEAVAAARAELATVPQMVPVYAHRYLPAGRGTHGHPVLSIQQTDVIYYGADLPDYVDREFNAAAALRGWGDEDGEEAEATVPFWRDL